MPNGYQVETLSAEREGTTTFSFQGKTTSNLFSYLVFPLRHRETQAHRRKSVKELGKLENFPFRSDSPQ